MTNLPTSPNFSSMSAPSSLLNTSLAPKQRINSIDALRGFALFGILMFHCMEHFDLATTPELASPFWQMVDTAVFSTISFLFAGKAYAIFALLFGLSFFMQMDSQADRGVDFRWRFLWRMALLLVLGYLNGIIYMGEFLVVYALLGVVLIPLYRVPTRWLIVLAVLLFLQLPDIWFFVSALSSNGPAEPTAPILLMDRLYVECADVFMNGSLSDVLDFNLWKGHLAKLLWVFNNARYPQLIGLFVAGMLIGRSGIYKDAAALVRTSRRVLPYAAVAFIMFYSVVLLLPHIGLEGFALRTGTMLFRAYANLSQMVLYVSGFFLIYHTSRASVVLDRLAPVGRMSVTNYMTQGFIGVPLFYGFGLHLAVKLSFLECFLVGLAIYCIQIVWSNLWMRCYYYGPIEWLWRTATWFRAFPLRREPKA